MYLLNFPILLLTAIGTIFTITSGIDQLQSASVKDRSLRIADAISSSRSLPSASFRTADSTDENVKKAPIAARAANPGVLYTDRDKQIDHHHKISAENNIFLNAREVFLINYVKEAISFSEQHISELTPEIFAIEGMSSSKNRCLLNNLTKLPGTNYLEIGCWKGSTFISALYHNQNSLNSAIAIDNWSEFGGPYQEFQHNCDFFIKEIPYKFYKQDCFSIDPKIFVTSPINLYFFDGEHTFEAQEKAFTYYDPFFADVFIGIVDDWNHPPVRDGTFSAFSKLNYEILYEIYLPARYNGDRENWWNGFYIAVIRK